MKNKIIKITLCMLSVLCFMACEYFAKPALPSFDIVVLKDTLSIYNTASIKKGTPVVFFYFSPECDHCQFQTDSILTNMDSLRNVKFYFLSNDSMNLVKEFSKSRNMDKYDNVLVGIDMKGYYLKHYTPKSTPSVAIFDKKQQLKYMLDGGTDIHTLIRLVNNVN